MSTSAISSVFGVSPGQTEASVRQPTQSLGQEDFLQLLVAQLSAQDPMNPQKDTEFIAQMAQFNALEQSRMMQTDIAGMRTDQQVLQATGLIGRTVSVQDGTGALVTGVVNGVNLAGSTPQIVVNGGAFPLSSLLGVIDTPLPLPN